MEKEKEGINTQKLIKQAGIVLKLRKQLSSLRLTLLFIEELYPEGFKKNLEMFDTGEDFNLNIHKEINFSSSSKIISYYFYIIMRKTLKILNKTLSKLNFDTLNSLKSEITSLENTKNFSSFFLPNEEIAHHSSLKCIMNGLNKQLYFDYYHNIDISKFEEVMDKVTKLVPDYGETIFKREILTNLFNDELDSDIESSESDLDDPNTIFHRKLYLMFHFLRRKSKIDIAQKCFGNNDLIKEIEEDQSGSEPEYDEDDYFTYNYRYFEMYNFIYFRYYQLKKGLACRNHLKSQELTKQNENRLSKLIVEMLDGSIQIRMNKMIQLNSRKPKNLQSQDEIDQKEIIVRSNEDKLRQDEPIKFSLKYISFNQIGKINYLSSRLDIKITKDQSQEKISIIFQDNQNGSEPDFSCDNSKSGKYPFDFFSGISYVPYQFVKVELSPCEEYMMIKSENKEDRLPSNIYKVYWIDYDKFKIYYLQAFVVQVDYWRDLISKVKYNFDHKSNIIEDEYEHDMKGKKLIKRLFCINKEFEFVNSGIDFEIFSKELDYEDESDDVLQNLSDDEFKNWFNVQFV